MDPIQRQLLEQLIAMYAMKDDGTRNPNGVQDVNQMLLDPMTAILGGSEGLDPAAFMPSIEYKDIDLDIPDEPVGRQMLDAYLGSGGDTPQAILAESIEKGMMPEQAIQQIAEKFELDEDGVKALQGLGTTFMKEKLDFTQAESDYTRKMEALPRDEQGNIMRQERVETPSELTEQFRAAGLATPDEQFDASYFTDTVAPERDYQNAMSALATSQADGPLARMQEKVDGLWGQKNQGNAAFERPQAPTTRPTVPQQRAFDQRQVANEVRDPTDQGTAIQRALAEQGSANLQQFPEGSLEALMQQAQQPASSDFVSGRTPRGGGGSRLNVGPGVSATARHRGRVADAPRNAERRNERQNVDYDAQIKQATSALQRERDRMNATASKARNKTAYAGGQAAYARRDGATPLSRQLLARLVSAQG